MFKISATLSRFQDSLTIILFSPGALHVTLCSIIGIQMV
jgi:hypothetical protein